jgi:hypothetical protein
VRPRILRVDSSRRIPKEDYAILSGKANSSDTYFEERLTADTENKL